MHVCVFVCATSHGVGAFATGTQLVPAPHCVPGASIRPKALSQCPGSIASRTNLLICHPVSAMLIGVVDADIGFIGNSYTERGPPDEEPQITCRIRVESH